MARKSGKNESSDAGTDPIFALDPSIPDYFWAYCGETDQIRQREKRKVGNAWKVEHYFPLFM